MTTQTLTITEFLLARIAEDEAWADSRNAAECTAKRKIVELHRGWSDDVRGWCCDLCFQSDADPAFSPCGTVAALAAIYSDHPDYRAEWA